MSSYFWWIVTFLSVASIPFVLMALPPIVLSIFGAICLAIALAFLFNGWFCRT